MTSSLSIAQARRIALAAQGLAAPSRAGATRWGQLERSIRALNLLQIDSVNVLARSHYLPLFSRLGPYSQALLDKRTLAPTSRRVFEYWAHEASFLPLELYPLMRWRMQRAERGQGIYGGLSRFARENRAYVRSVLAEVRTRGPTAVSDLSDPGQRSGNWWGWSKGKMALEHLFDSGLLTTASRRGFERLYDIAERIIPGDLLNAAAPAEADAIRALVDLSARALGVGTQADLRDYFRLPVAETRQAVGELVEARVLVAVEVEGWKQPAYLHGQARLPRQAAGAALVSPFDPIVWERARTQRLFDFRYRIEIYTPAPQRIYGYYVLPFLRGEMFAARVCLKADRQAGVLRVNAAHLEDAAAAADTARELANELLIMAGWLGLAGVSVSPNGSLAAELGRQLE